MSPVGRLRAAAVVLALTLVSVVVPASAGAATITVTNSVSVTGMAWRATPISVTSTGSLTASLSWSTATAKLTLGLSRQNADGTWTWMTGSSGAQPLALTWPVTPGQWRLSVKAISGASSYTLTATYPTSSSPSVEVALSPPSVTADGASTSVATATVTNADGSSAIGATLDFASSDPGQTIGPVSDNGDGTYSATITASTRAGIATITANDESVSPTLSGTATLTERSTAPPQVTLVFSRTELSAADNSSGGEGGTCTRDDEDIAPLDTVVAPYVAQNYPNVHPVGSIETGLTSDSGHWCPHHGESYGSSWSDLTALANLGWTFIDHSATYPTKWANLTQQQDYDQTCGSRDVITAHGLTGASGQFDWPNNKFDSTVNNLFVTQCFSFSRGYGSGVTTAAQVQMNNGQQSTRGATGGHCHVTGQPCSTLKTGKAYTLPSSVITQMDSLTPGQWLNLQTYVLVTGKSPTYTTDKARWDCTNPDPRYHWSNDVERYCWSDMQTILAALNADANVQSNSPSGVAALWGWPPPPS
jgi:hypothetical protein